MKLVLHDLQTKRLWQLSRLTYIGTADYCSLRFDAAEWPMVRPCHALLQPIGYNLTHLTRLSTSPKSDLWHNGRPVSVSVEVFLGDELQFGSNGPRLVLQPLSEEEMSEDSWQAVTEEPDSGVKTSSGMASVSGEIAPGAVAWDLQAAPIKPPTITPPPVAEDMTVTVVGFSLSQLQENAAPHTDKPAPPATPQPAPPALPAKAQRSGCLVSLLSLPLRLRRRGSEDN